MTWRSLVRLLPGVGGFFYLSFPGKQVYWMVSENGRVGAMKQKKERGKRNQPMAMDFHAAVRNPGGILGR